MLNIGSKNVNEIYRISLQEIHIVTSVTPGEHINNLFLDKDFLSSRVSLVFQLLYGIEVCQKLIIMKMSQTHLSPAKPLHIMY